MVRDYWRSEVARASQKCHRTGVKSWSTRLLGAGKVKMGETEKTAANSWTECELCNAAIKAVMMKEGA